MDVASIFDNRWWVGPFSVALVAVFFVTAHTTKAQSVHLQSQDIDCVAVVHRRWDTDLPIRFAAWSPAQQSQCLEQLLKVVSDLHPSADFEPVTGAIEDLAREGLISNPSVFGPLIDCVRTRERFDGMFCNRAIEALTRHPYGRALFAGGSGALAWTAASRDQVVDDWSRLLRAIDPGRPIFDLDLKKKCTDAMHAISAGLANAVLLLLGPGNPMPGYLDAFKNGPLIPNGDGEEIFEFAVGDGPGLGLPANWLSGDRLKGMRFVLFRPGVANPSSVSQFDLQRDSSAAHRLPSESSDYREVFQVLDLEFRFQVFTSSAELRRTTVTAVRDGLKGLRLANTANR